MGLNVVVHYGFRGVSLLTLSYALHEEQQQNVALQNEQQPHARQPKH